MAKQPPPATGHGKLGRTFSIPTADGKPIAGPETAVGRRPIFRATGGPTVKKLGNPGKSGRTRDIPGDGGDSRGIPGDHPMETGLPHESGTSKPKRDKHPGRQRLKCGAKARTTGKPCRRWALRGRKRCKLHGGASLRGPASATWKTGFYSAALPADVAKLARQAAADTELRNIRDGIALADVRIRDLCGSLELGTGSWDAAAKALRNLQAAGDDLNAARKALDDLGAAVATGRTVEAAWKEIRELLQEKDRLLTGEVARHKATADTINADRVSAFMVGMIDALRDESNDRDLLRRVFVRWERLMGLAGVTAPAEKVQL